MCPVLEELLRSLVTDLEGLVRDLHCPHQEKHKALGLVWVSAVAGCSPATAVVLPHQRQRLAQSPLLCVMQLQPWRSALHPVPCSGALSAPTAPGEPGRRKPVACPAS